MTAFIIAHSDLIWGYLILINLLAFALFGIDKGKARRKAWRIPEATLFLFAFLYGALGAFLGMRLFHHKTLHTKFRIGIPLLMTVQLIFGAWVLAMCV